MRTWNVNRVGLVCSSTVGGLAGVTGGIGAVRGVAEDKGGGLAEALHSVNTSECHQLQLAESLR